MLLLVYIFNFLDRQILSILVEPIKDETGFSDTQMGLLGGLPFAILYSTMAIPFSALADRTSRSKVIAAALVVWSGFTALFGLTHAYWQMFLARMGVGVGEAGGVAPSYALIADYFPSTHRARAISVYSLGIPLGSAFGLLAGGYIAANVDWRAAFITVGLAGILIAPLFLWIVKDVPEPVAPANTPSAFWDTIGETWAIVRRKKAFWLMALGAASASMIGYGLAFWFPAFLMRSFEFDLQEASRFVAGLLLSGGVAGILASGILADKIGKKDRAFYTRLPAVAFVLAVPLFAAGILSENPTLAFFIFIIPQALVYFWLGPILSAVQHLVEPRLRATASALFLLINNLIGLAGGIYALGAFSDALKPAYGDEALRYSMLFGLALYLLAAALLAAAGPALRKGWVDEAG
ncbi:spinster family MFS transporter [Paraurantiacibacter namhicola]|nr:MFS transporter [Paraurantiacibacter namhicola]